MRTSKTEVYWNLHRGGYSVRQNGIVIAHTDRICLSDARFVVQHGGWERTVREHRKRVHAMVRGKIVEAQFVEAAEGKSRHRPRGTVAVTYNPYRADHFQVRATGERIDTARLVWFSVKDGKAVVEAW
jgi:hypothetical protein